VARSGHNEGKAGLSRADIHTVLLAPDSFKGSLTAGEAASAMGEGVLEVLPSARLLLHPVSDGGEGLCDILTPALEGTIQQSTVPGPLPGEMVRARWGYSPSRSTAIIEMAEASGLLLIPPPRRDPKVTTTRGVGELIRLALASGARKIIVGIGGSATTDGGAGMAEALGVRFLDGNGENLPPGGAALAGLRTIDLSGITPALRDVRVIAACDVRNPLLGPEGAASVFAPQKGASPADVILLEQALENYRDRIRDFLGIDVQSVPGSGAAGGLGAGLLAFCRAELRSGIDILLDATRFDQKLRTADLVLTGEGRIDTQSGFGKALSGVLKRSRAAGKPVLAVVGSMAGMKDDYLGPDGFDDLSALVHHETSVEEAMARAVPILRTRTSSLIRSFLGMPHA
jgi:glycerate 2-kinase